MCDGCEHFKRIQCVRKDFSGGELIGHRSIGRREAGHVGNLFRFSKY